MYVTKTDADPVKAIIFGNEYDKDGIVIFNSGYNITASTLQPESTWIKKGTLVGVDRATGLATLVKTAKIESGGTASAPRVDKKHEVVVGDLLTDGYIVRQVSAVDTSNSDYDVLTFTASLEKYSEGTILMSAAEGSVRAANYSEATVVEAATKNLIVKVAGANGLQLILNQNDTDSLRVTFNEGKLIVSLAKTTASKNSISLIQASIKGLGKIDGVDFTDAKVYAINWNDITGGTLTTPSDDFKLGTPVSQIQPYPEPRGFVWVSKKKIGTPSVAVVSTAHEVIEDSLPYFLNDVIKEQMKSWFTFE